MSEHAADEPAGVEAFKMILAKVCKAIDDETLNDELLNGITAIAEVLNKYVATNTIHRETLLAIIAQAGDKNRAVCSEYDRGYFAALDFVAEIARGGVE